MRNYKPKDEVFLNDIDPDKVFGKEAEKLIADHNKFVERMKNDKEFREQVKKESKEAFGELINGKWVK